MGKTGLGWRIAHREFKEHPSTHGQQFWVIDELGATRADGTQCEAVLWDFAGQPDYRLIHALFLDDVDLALVMFDPGNRVEPLKGVEYWLKQLSRPRAQACRTILVGARIDRGSPTLTGDELEEFCRQNNIDGRYIGTSARTGEGVAELLKRVKELVAWEDKTATVTTATFKRIKEYVLALKENARRREILVSPVELRKRLQKTDKKWQFSDAEMMTAVSHLANHGYTMVLRQSSGEESVLLTPDVLANLASSFVLEARRDPKGLGVLNEERVLQGGYKFPELSKLKEPEKDILLDAATVLFLEHAMCFRETLGTQTFLVFPALINQKRPHLDNQRTVDDVSYKVSGAVENVYAALVVLLGYTNTFTRTNQWQNQAQYETSEGELCGFRQVEEREGESEFVLYFGEGATRSRLLFQGLFEQFLRGRDVSIIRYPCVLCPKCGYRQRRELVVSRIDEGKGFLYCGECGKKIMLPKAGEPLALTHGERESLDAQQGVARRRKNYETALTHVKALMRDRGVETKAPVCFISYACGKGAHERWVETLAKDLRNAGVEVVFDRWHSPPGSSIAKFIERIVPSDFVAVVGTPGLRQKYETETADPVVDAELRLINTKLRKRTKERERVLPLLLDGTIEDSFPPLFEDSVCIDFRREESYFVNLFDLVLRLHHIRFDDNAVIDLRESMRREAGKMK
ncbi:MAG TPA: TIR domain-containing protein [Pyrinomonadaceae bacterium]|nr:TIR domain-containing protein [Pyrinomonadaceae bacterium]